MPISYEQIRDHLDTALRICESMDLRPRTTRFGEYRRRLETLMSVVKKRQAGQSVAAEETAIAQEQMAYMIALTESVEFGDIMATLADTDLALLKPKLQDVLRGQPLPIDEDPSRGNKARNTLFELSLAAQLKRAGFQPTLGEHPDLSINLDGKLIAWECKRPFSEKKVDANLEAAEKQLARTLGDYRIVSPTARGIVAVSLSKTINPGDRVLPYPAQEIGRGALERGLEKLVHEHAATYQRFEDRIIAVLFHTIVPGLDQTANRYEVGQQVLMEILAPRGSWDARLAVRLAEAMKKTAY